MPTIPILTAGAAPGRVQFPRATQFAVPIEHGGEEITQAGLRFLEISQQLRRQQDDLDLFRALTETEAALGQHRMALTVDPNYAEHDERFLELASKTVQDRLKTLNPTVAAVYAPRAERMIAEGAITIQTGAMKRQAEQQQIEFTDLSEQVAQQFATAENPEARDGIRNRFSTLLDRNQVATPTQRAGHLAALDEKAMKYLRLTNRPRLREWQREGVFRAVDPVKQAEILRQAAEDDEAEHRRGNAATAEAMKIHEDGLWARANIGALTPVDQHSLVNNQDPLVDPRHVAAIIERNENPIGPGAAGPIEAIMLDYRSGSATPDRIEAHRKRLNALRDQGVNQKKLTEALATLQGQEMSRTLAEMNLDVRTFETALEAESPPLMPGQAGQFQKNKRAREAAEGRREIIERRRPGADVLKEWRERKRRQKEEQQRRGTTTLHDLSERLGR